jgi:hypothetical protein
MQLGIPSLRDSPAGKQLFVDGETLLIRGAELQNSPMAFADYMKVVWPKLAAAKINTVLGAVPWDIVLKY